MQVKEKGSNKSFYLTLLVLIEKGMNPTKICKELNLSKQNLNYYLRQLKKKGIIKKLGYGVWKIQSKNLTSEHGVNSSKNIRGHAFIWKIKLHQPKDWINILEKHKIKYKLIRNCIPRIYFNNKKIWLGKESITIYEPNSYYGINAIESRKHAVFNLLETLEHIERTLKINLRPYTFTPAREHFALIKNDLANQCNKNN
ncbi:unnamed protein product, partial [marine sediment metagenome]